MSSSSNAAPRAGLITGVLAMCGIVVSLMQTLVIPLIPRLPELLDASAANASWVVTATLLAAAVVTPISGRLGDMYGKRRILLLSLLMLVIGSVLSAVSSSLVPVVAGRALQGCAMGAIPLGISIMRDELPPERVGKGVSVMSATMGVGGAVGLPVAAAVAQYADWHALFWASAAAGLAVLIAILVVVPESTVRSPAPFDTVGALGLAAGLVCLMLAITKGGTWGWGSARVLGLFAGAVVILAVWSRYEMSRGSPLVDLRVTLRRPVLLTNLASVLVGFAMYAMSLIFPQLLMAPASTGYGMGQSMLVAGLVLAPGGLVMMALSPVSARISGRHGPRRTLVIGLVVIGFGYLLALVLMSQIWQIILCSMVISAGVGIAYAAMPSLIIASVPVRETAAANGINTLMRSVGTSTSSAVMSVLLAAMAMSTAGGLVPTLTGFRVSLIVSIAAAAAGILITLMIPASRPGEASERTGPVEVR